MGLLKSAEFPKREMIARLDVIEGADGEGTLSFLFDAIDERMLPDPIKEKIRPIIVGDNFAPFALLRTETSKARFEDFSGMAGMMARDAREGQWFAISVAPIPGDDALPCWHSPLSDEGYLTHTQGFITRLERLFEDEGIAPRPLGATVPNLLQKAHAVKAASEFPRQTPSIHSISNPTADLATAVSVVVRDVGQASFVDIVCADGSIALHYDVGWPISFHDDGAPSITSVQVQPSRVLLSHWDWDHMHGYYRFPCLKKCQWLTPRRALGPGAGRVAGQLFDMGRLLAFDATTFSIDQGIIVRATGSNANQSGLALYLPLASSRKGLLVGDADYDRITMAPGLPSNFDFLCVTHHGAKFEGEVPDPVHEGCVAAVSVGKGNYYGHPNADALQSHEDKGWKVEMTMDQPHSPRGDRVLK